MGGRRFLRPHGGGGAEERDHEHGQDTTTHESSGRGCVGFTRRHPGKGDHTLTPFPLRLAGTLDAARPAGTGQTLDLEFEGGRPQYRGQDSMTGPVGVGSSGAAAAGVRSGACPCCEALVPMSQDGFIGYSAGSKTTQ